MASLLDDLASAVESVRAVWRDEEMTGDELIAANRELGRARRLLEAAHARVSHEIARQSRPELGPERLVKKQGFRNPTTLVAATTGITAGEANRLLKIGEATAARETLDGGQAPPKYPAVADAVRAGAIGAWAAEAIIRVLDQIAIPAGRERTGQVERDLVATAPGLTPDQLQRILLQARAVADPEGLERREAQQRAETFLRVREDADGMIVLNGRFDPVRGAPIKTAIEAHVGAQLRAARHRADAQAGTGTGAGGGADDGAAGGGLDAPTRTIPQLQADALVQLCEHALSCDSDLPLDSVTVIVRVNLTDLQNGTGLATIDGIAAPLSIPTARRLASSAGIIPCVLGADSEILDWGREKRLYTKPQKLALGERDGGCAMCAAPPGHTKAHHLKWWTRDAGPTDLDNGILLCESCHHHIHDNGWNIRIDGRGTRAKVWFTPPPDTDPTQTPRLGGRARYHYAA